MFIFLKINLMKTILLLTLCLLGFSSLNAQTDNPKYNKSLADSLGADEYGMKKYVLVILKSGTNKTEDKKVIENAFRGHMENIGRLVESKKLIVAGPLVKNEKSYRGIFILNVQTLEEANELLKTDPAITANLLEAESFVWYGSAALPLYLEGHEQIEKVKH